MGDYAFEYCTSFISITIPDSVTNIDAWAFFGCNNLKTVIFENTNGWNVSSSSTATSSTEIDVSNTSQNATYLMGTYYNYYWYRNEE
ncbi:MAG: leucine-rich repeat domain-containing protein [Clostridia bacterium]|nr:leucine-rich repeat domain-containing protein [Clostridia bacterium]